MKVLITGATGFIGQHVLRQLLDSGNVVRALIRPETYRRQERMRALAETNAVETVVGTLADVDTLVRAVDGMDVVYHLAGLGGVNRPHDEYVSVNVRGTQNLLQASALAGVHRFVYTSTTGVYRLGLGRGQRRDWPLSENAPLAGRGGYVVTKIEAEQLIQDYQRTHGLQFVILRICLVYGSDAPYLGRIITQIAASPVALTPLGERRSVQLVHIHDAARAVILAGTRAEAANEIFNIAGEEPVTWRYIAQTYHGDDFDRPFLRRRQCGGATPPPTHFDTTKARELLGFSPKVDVFEELPAVIRGLN